MFAQKILISVAVVSLLSVSLNQPAQCRTTRLAKHSASMTQSPQSDEAAVRAQLAALKDCVATGDATAMVKLWTEDGRYIDDEGSEYSGRSALEKNFSSAFKENGKPQVEIVADSIRIPANNIALVDGVVKRKQGSDVVPVTRYSMVLVKQKGDWLISSATETPIASHATFNPLQSLDWMIGDWSVERDGASVNMKAEWVPSRNFIFCRYEIKKADDPQKIETQVIGWDPRNQRPISWTFDSSGGFGQGRWSQGNNQWQVDACGVERNGSVTTSTNVYSKIDPNGFSWQSVNRQVDGVSVADSLPLKVQRVAK